MCSWCLLPTVKAEPSSLDTHLSLTIFGVGERGLLVAQSQMDEKGDARRAHQAPKCSEWAGTADALSHSQVTLGWAERNI